MRNFSKLVLPLFLASGVAVAACSDTSVPIAVVPDAAPLTDGSIPVTDGSPTPDTGPTTDAAPIDAAPPADGGSDASDVCGPMIKTSGQVDFPVRELTASPGSSTFITGLRVEAIPCGRVPSFEEPSGFLHPAHPAVPFAYRLIKLGYLPTLMEQLDVAINTSGTSPQKNTVLVKSDSATATFPGYDVNTGNLLLRVEANSAACAAGAWTVAITGHPEAMVSYWTAVPSTPGALPSGAQTPASTDTFYISASKINPASAAPIAFTVSGAACALALPPGIGTVKITGKVAFEPGSVTFVDAIGN